MERAELETPFFFHELCNVYVYNMSRACILSRMEGQ